MKKIICLLTFIVCMIISNSIVRAGQDSTSVDVKFMIIDSSTGKSIDVSDTAKKIQFSVAGVTEYGEAEEVIVEDVRTGEQRREYYVRGYFDASKWSANTLISVTNPMLPQDYVLDYPARGLTAVFTETDYNSVQSDIVNHSVSGTAIGKTIIALAHKKGMLPNIGVEYPELGIDGFSTSLDKDMIVASFGLTGEEYDNFIVGIGGIYTGKAYTPAVKLLNPHGEEVDSSQYDISYENNVKAGIAKIVINGKNGLTGTLTRVFEIEKAQEKISLSAKSKKVKSKVLKKKKMTFSIKVKNCKSSLVAVPMNTKNISVKVVNKTIKVTVRKKTKKGKYKIRIQAKGNDCYSQSAYKYFEVNVK